jgi:uncharacterized protein with FMN-binding domain
MKRVLMTIAATVVGIVALLSYKTHGAVTSSASALPSAGLPATSTSASSATPSSSATTTGAPPDPSATPSSTTATSAPSSITYTGSAITTRYGIVQVKITVSAKKITNVGFVQLTAFDGRSQRINSGAAPILLQETLSAQSAHIDSVSGASYTSEGYDQSLQSALDKAGL